MKSAQSMMPPAARHFLLALATVLPVMATVVLVPAQASENETTTLEQLKQESAEALEAMKEYSVEKRDEVVEHVKITLDRLDSRIDELEARLDSKSAEMTEAVREETRTKLQMLRRKRNDLAEWYGGIKHSTSGAWEEAKDGLVKSYETMSDSMIEAWEEL